MARLGDVATFINGYAFKPEDWSSTGLPIIRIQDLTGNSYQANRYNGDYLKKYEVNEGDILISWSASLGVYVWHGEKALLNQHIFKVVFDKVEISKSFFVYQVESILEKAASAAHGATMKHLTKPVFDALPFYLPPLDEQRKIAAVLDKVSDLIAKRRQQLDKLDTLVKARFVEMFGDPENNPKKWPVKKLAAVVSSITAGWSVNGEARSRNTGEKAVLKVSAVTQGFFRPDEYKVISADMEIKKYVYPQKGDLLFSRANTRELVGATAVIEQDYPELLLPDKLWKVLFTNEMDVYYAKHILSTQAIRKVFSSQSTGTSGSMFNVSTEKFRETMIPVPPIMLQHEFANFVQQTNKSKSEVIQSLEKLKTLKKSLMQQYFE